jgi:hypothetical protein
MSPASGVRARSFDIVGYDGFHSGARRVFAIILLASAPKGRSGAFLQADGCADRESCRARIAFRLCRPFGRPLGLPDWPGFQCVCFGGLH